jgi:microcompartment protein CcmK/EutM
MLHGIVIGHATATVKHPSLTGWRLAVVQTLGADGKPEGDAMLVVDNLGCRAGAEVLINNDGRRVREMIGDEKSPARWFVCALVDESVDQAAT